MTALAIAELRGTIIAQAQRTSCASPHRIYSGIVYALVFLSLFRCRMLLCGVEHSTGMRSPLPPTRAVCRSLAPALTTNSFRVPSNSVITASIGLGDLRSEVSKVLHRRNWCHYNRLFCSILVEPEPMHGESRCSRRVLLTGQYNFVDVGLAIIIFLCVACTSMSFVCPCLLQTGDSGETVNGCTRLLRDTNYLRWDCCSCG